MVKTMATVYRFFHEDPSLVEVFDFSVEVGDLVEVFFGSVFVQTSCVHGGRMMYG